MQPLNPPRLQALSTASGQSWLTSEQGPGKMGDGPGTPTTNP